MLGDFDCFTTIQLWSHKLTPSKFIKHKETLLKAEEAKLTCYDEFDIKN